MNKDDFINKLHELYRQDTFVNDLFQSIASSFQMTLDGINELKAQFFFDTMTYLLPVYEKIMNIIPTEAQSIEDRRVVVEAHWKSSGHNNITLLQNVANTWKNGETLVSFIAGKIKIEFIGAYGIPNDLNALLAAMEKIKPAHIPYFTAFKWLLIKDIHNVKTVNQMQSLTISQFARGVE